MTFGAPGYGLFFSLVAAAALALLWWTAWRGDARARFGGRTPGGARTALAATLALAAAAVAIFAAARPQYGEDTVRVEDRGIDMVIVLDVSQSMFSTDAEPTRLGQAQAEIRDLLGRMSGDRVGLVIFAGRPFPRSPLTSDLAALAGIVDGVDRERALVPAGSDLGLAIRRGRELIASGDASTKALLIVSDGEDHGGRVTAAIEEARSAGIRVFSAGAGTASGSPVLDVDPDTGVPEPRIDASGDPVITRLDAAALREMAAAGDGRYVELGGEPLSSLAPEFDDLAATTFGTEETSEPIERFQIFAAIALALAAGAVAASARGWRPREALRLAPLAGGALLIAGICSTDAADLNRRGNRHYDAGEYTSAVYAYQTAQAMAPGRPELHHNAGNAFDQSGEYASAIDETQRGLPTDDAELEALLEYALGNHFAGAERLQEAIEAYRRALLADPDDRDAKHNLELLQRRLTPSPEPTPSLPATQVPGEGQPTPSGDGQPGGQNQGTPGPQSGDEGTPGTTPGAGQATPGPGGGELSPEQLQRLLDEALAGIDEEFTTEEALELLELLEEQNRGQLSQRRGSADGLPDY